MIHRDGDDLTAGRQTRRSTWNETDAVASPSRFVQIASLDLICFASILPNHSLTRAKYKEGNLRFSPVKINRHVR
jgi:hypothetical protein